MITADDLRSILSYDPNTGDFVWIAPPSPAKVKTGDIAGCTMSDGYKSITIHRKMYKQHRLAWLYMTGEWPPTKLDHVNRDRGDNRFSNLRLATPKQNTANRTSWSRYGLKGVSVNHRCKTNPWRSSIETRVGGRRIFRSLGVYKTKEEAHEAYMAALRELHPIHAKP